MHDAVGDHRGDPGSPVWTAAGLAVAAGLLRELRGPCIDLSEGGPYDRRLLVRRLDRRRRHEPIVGPDRRRPDGADPSYR